MTTLTINQTDMMTLKDEGSLDMLISEMNCEEQSKMKEMLEIFESQRRLSDKLFDKWFTETNAPLLKDIDSFLDMALDVEGQDLFPETCSLGVYPVQLIIGTQASDHPTSLNMIEKHIRKNRRQISLLRLKPARYTRSTLLTTIDELSGEDNILVIIEQIETLDVALVDQIVNQLYRILATSETQRAMLMFCLSSSFLNISSILHEITVNRMKKFTDIVQNPLKALIQLPERLLRSKNVFPKISPNIYPIINQTFLENDCTVTNLKFIYQSLQFHYCLTDFALVALRPGNLASTPQLLNNIRHALRTTKLPEDWDWNDSGKMSQVMHESLRRHNQNHETMMDQLECYYKIIRFEGNWPSYMTDIYEELGSHKDLSHSVQFVDAVAAIRRIPVDRLIKRMQDSLESSNGLRHKPGMVQFIVHKYLQQMENNQDSPNLVSDFINDLLLHIRNIRGPLNQILYQVAYFDNFILAREAIKPSYRRSLATNLIDKNSYYGILYDIISNSPCDIVFSDLYEEFVDAVKLKIQHPQERPINQANTNIKFKSTPRKRDRGKSLLVSTVPVKRTKPPSLDEGLLTAIFVDLIETMEVYQRYIRRDLRKSRKGFISRSAWLNV